MKKDIILSDTLYLGVILLGSYFLFYKGHNLSQSEIDFIHISFIIFLVFLILIHLIMYTPISFWGYSLNILCLCVFTIVLIYFNNYYLEIKSDALKKDELTLYCNKFYGTSICDTTNIQIQSNLNPSMDINGFVGISSIPFTAICILIAYLKRNNKTQIDYS